MTDYDYINMVLDQWDLVLIIFSINCLQEFSPYTNATNGVVICAIPVYLLLPVMASPLAGLAQITSTTHCWGQFLPVLPALIRTQHLSCSVQFMYGKPNWACIGNECMACALISIHWETFSVNCYIISSQRPFITGHTCPISSLTQ